MTTKLQLRMTTTETDVDYLTSHFVKLPDMTVYHNMLRDMSTACGIQLVCVLPHHLGPLGEPRCSRCMKAIDVVLR